ncbi:Uncharacterised protein [Mycobacteroides abscessus subsp. abscessus]|uniref:Uncharacterized protein n=4 Tax=Mycobacteroides abscessus TaxID=36809 RepID=B1MND1_MYCA9|nr:hypothetical protein [Mycobacteroides abscessus]QPO17525.1 hypothetical protein PHIGD23-1_68 [Mycobacterium phage phiGD23-1]QPO17645.1 hypothetical protein PHIGD22-1_68 [Mycobacterium phage phiGD22-1]QPO17827.1 hypothetical protein PROPHIGD20-1_66 [Mycobacterium phage phiGD20-1]QSM01705.1 hypothetical protein PROPHIGD11-1_35 [Mycobacterium phage prophiGD11-1]QSM02088.1 hypothetical protein PROPHIGD20-1_34 [Mycobacterium phage prophiGD20-1]QSM02448.1 hypothetical protein PROPHIGD17-2_31 [My
MSEPKNANEIITQAAIRWYGPAFTLGSAGFGGFILEELKANGYAVVELPRSLPVTPEVQSGCEHTCLIGSDLLAAAAAAARDSEER